MRPAISFVIKQEREAQGLSQRQLAIRSKVTPAYICDVEAGRRGMSSAVAKRVSKVLGLHTDYLEAMSGRIPADIKLRKIPRETFLQAFEMLRAAGRAR